MRTRTSVTVVAASCLMFFSCQDQGEPIARMNAGNLVASDATLFEIVTATQPFRLYALFPHVDSVTSGTLNGSTAHQPLVRVSMNATALGALRNGRLPAGTRFPDGSIIFKEVQTANGLATIYAVIYKQSNNSLANNGWLWAEYSPDGSVLFSIAGRGSGCVGCHAREQGPRNDYVRTFERQR